MNMLCFSFDGVIELRQQGRNRFTVIYGQQVKENLSYNEAATELGAAIMHNAACNAELDNRMPGEH